MGILRKLQGALGIRPSGIEGVTSASLLAEVVKRAKGLTKISGMKTPAQSGRYVLFGVPEVKIEPWKQRVRVLAKIAKADEPSEPPITVELRREWRRGQNDAVLIDGKCMPSPDVDIQLHWKLDRVEAVYRGEFSLASELQDINCLAGIEFVAKSYYLSGVL